MNNIVFKKLELRNFLSFGNNTQEIDLEFNGSSLIVGENADTQSANGAGKSTILNAIAYALYNKPVSNISKERLINKTNSSKNTLMEVRLTFTHGDIEYEVYRARGESYIIQLFEDGEDITPDSVAACDKKIVEVIGVSYDLFCRVVIFSGNDLAFLDMPIAMQRILIEELFNITTLSEKAIKLREQIKQTETDISVQTVLIKQQEALQQSHEKRIRDALSRIEKWDMDREQGLKTAYAEIEKLANVDFDAEEKNHTLINELVPQITKIKQNLSSISRDVDRKTKRKFEIQEEIEHLLEAKCPYCKQHFADSERKIDDLVPELEEKIEEVDTLSSKQKEDHLLLHELEEKVSNARSTLVFNSIQELLRAKASVAILEMKINELENGTNPHKEAYDAAVAEKIENVDYDKLNELKKLLEHQQFLLKLLTDKNSFIRKKIINRTTPFLNNRINHYTMSLGLPHNVKFDADMSCTLSEFGRELDFGNLSGGEKKRVNLALSLAFRDVFHHLHAKVNALFMDEVDGGSISTEGVDAMIKLIKQKSRDEDLGIWVISHRPEMFGRFDREILIRKQNGFSFIIEEGTTSE